MRTIGTATVFVIGMAASACSATPAKTQTLRDEAIAAIHAAMPDAEVTVVDPLAIKVKPPAGEEMQINLDRIQRFCEVNSAVDCAGEKQRFLGGIAEALTMDDAIKPAQLRLLVRSNEYAVAYATEIGDGKGQADPPVARPFAEGVSVMLGVDYPKTTKIPGQSRLKDLGISEAEAIALATRQVLASLPKVPTLQEVEGKLLVVAGIDYGASMMLEPERWRALALATGGRLFVAIPADNDVLIGTVESGKDLRKIEKMVAESYATAGRGISPHVYRWSPTGWIVAK
jgi:hypothetical protein